MSKRKNGPAAGAKPEERFFEAYDEYAAALLRHLVFRVGDNDAAQDLLSEIFTRTWQYMRGGGAPERLKSFLYKVADNLVVDHYRKKGRSASLDAMPETADLIGEDPREAWEAKLLYDRIIENGFDRLPEESRAILVYRYVDELEIGEIREITGRSAGSIYTAIHRGLKALRKSLENHET